MMSDKLTITKGHRYLLTTAAVMTCLLVALGGIVCITNSSQGCPDWPACYGQFIPPPRVDSIIEYTHRLIAALTTLLIIASAVVSWRKTRSIRWLSWPPVIAVVLTFAVIVFGAFVVLTGLPPVVAAIDLGSALLVLAFMVVTAVVARICHRNPALTNQISFADTFAKLVLWTVITIFIVFVSGVLVAESGSMVRCLGWPLYNVDFGDLGWPQVARHLVAGVAGVLIVATVGQAWRTQRNHPATLYTATATGGVFLAEIGVGILLPASDFNVFLLMAYVVLAAFLWALLVALAMLAGLRLNT